MAEIINDNDLGQVSGGWQYANGSFVNYGNYIVYTVAPGDVLSGIGQRFGVSYMQIAQWNNIKNPDKILIGQKLTIYPAVIRMCGESAAQIAKRSTEHEISRIFENRRHHRIPRTVLRLQHRAVSDRV